MTDINTAKIKIQKGFKIPPKVRAMKQFDKHLLDRMKANDSVAIPANRKGISLIRTCRSYAHRHKIKIALRRMSKGEFRLWRVSA